jgi:hypothetical protein
MYHMHLIDDGHRSSQGLRPESMRPVQGGGMERLNAGTFWEGRI